MADTTRGRPRGGRSRVHVGAATRPRPSGTRYVRPAPASDRTLFIATKNPGKVEELTALLAAGEFRVIGADRMKNLSAPAEDGRTFEANARKKAIHYSRQVPHLVLAEDSGLEIDKLDGKPGVRSARLGGPSATDLDRVRLIIKSLDRVPWDKRTARFRCVIALAKNGEVLETFSGAVEGLIAFEPAGSEGFGYDPIFYYPAARMTFAQMTQEEKSSVSHRAEALSRAAEWLLEHRVKPSRP